MAFPRCGRAGLSAETPSVGAGVLLQTEVVVNFVVTIDSQELLDTQESLNVREKQSVCVVKVMLHCVYVPSISYQLGLKSAV